MNPTKVQGLGCRRPPPDRSPAIALRISVPTLNGRELALMDAEGAWTETDTCSWIPGLVRLPPSPARRVLLYGGEPPPRPRSPRSAAKTALAFSCRLTAAVASAFARWMSTQKRSTPRPCRRTADWCSPPLRIARFLFLYFRCLFIVGLERLNRMSEELNDRLLLFKRICL